MTTDHSELWLYVDRQLAGRSWRWLAEQLPERVSDNTLRNWAEGRHPLKEFRADQLAAALGVHPNEIRSRAGLPLKESDVREPKPTITTLDEAGQVVEIDDPELADLALRTKALVELAAEIAEQVSRISGDPKGVGR